MPSMITAIRILLLPAICLHWASGNVAVSGLLYGVAVLSDVADGWAARRLGAASSLGAYLDVIADVVFLVSILLYLGFDGVVPLWLFACPLGAATAFFVTSQRTSPRYDPVGRHFGGILFVIVGCILLCPSGHSLRFALCSLIAVLSGIVFVNRLRLGLAPRTA